MKKTMKFLSMAALALVGAVMTGCSSDDNAVEEAPKQPANYSVTKTLTVNLDGGEAGARGITRALASGGEKTFAAGDKLAVIYMNEGGTMTKVETEELKAGNISGDGKTATFTVTLTEPPLAGKIPLTYIYPASIATSDGYVDNSQLSSQDGTLATLASNLDACRGYDPEWRSSGDLPALTLTNAFTIGKFIIKNPSGTAINDDLTSVTISDGTNTYTITPSASAADDPIWVAMRPISAGTPVTVTATDGTYNYSKTITIASGKDLLAGKIYPINVTTVLVPAVPTGAINGLFTVNSSGDQVYFSKGNLQAVGTTSSSPSSGWTWQFAEHQYDYIGGRSQGGSEPQTGNNYISGNGTLSADGTVDLFCWSTNATYYGIHNGEYSSTYSGDFYDWGNAIGSGWRTLTPAEWEWILGPSGSPTPGTNCRTSSTVNGVENARYAKATVVGKAGLIIFPDSYTHPGDATAPASVNTANAAYNSNSYDATAWGKMEVAGAVFLPAAGNSRRVNENNIIVADSEFLGFYWSTVPYVDAYNDKAYQLVFFPEVVEPSGYSTKNLGFSVRLVRNAN